MRKYIAAFSSKIRTYINLQMCNCTHIYTLCTLTVALALVHSCVCLNMCALLCQEQPYKVWLYSSYSFPLFIQALDTLLHVHEWTNTKSSAKAIIVPKHDVSQ